MESSVGMDKSRKRHCWECLRRRLVCDSTRPVCRRCSTSGIVCPGYDDAKPLRWLAPGKVTSRKRRIKGASSSDIKLGNGRNKATARTKTELSPETHAVVPRLEMRTEMCAVAQAAEYFNTCIYQDLVPIQELGPNPHIYLISPTHLREVPRCPDHLRLSFVCMTLSHRINRTRDGPPSTALAETFYRYRGMAIRSLSEDLTAEHKHTSDVVIAGVISFLLADVQQVASLNWRCHLEGAQRLITLRGGIRALAKSISLDPLLRCYVFVAVIGNTTCPASDLAMTSAHFEDVDFILERYGGGIFPFQMCPPLLFGEVIKINHLRMRAMKPLGAEDLSQEAYDILNRVNSFSPEHWAESKPSSMEDWVLLGSVYQISAALYCISSLQSLSVLPLGPSLRTCQAAHTQLLYLLLNEAVSSPRIKRFVLWPLVVLGVEAVDGGAAMRTFVGKQLAELSRHLGTYIPLQAKVVLERFWASGETSWDACFDKPYALATQIAVDMRSILS